MKSKSLSIWKSEGKQVPFLHLPPDSHTFSQNCSPSAFLGASEGCSPGLVEVESVPRLVPEGLQSWC